MDSPLGSTSLTLRDHNSHAVYRALGMLRKASAGELAEVTGLTTVTVGTLLHQLCLRGAVREGGLLASRGGRPAREYLFEEQFCLVAGLVAREVGGQDTIGLRVADLTGQCIHQEDFALTPSCPDDLQNLLDPLFLRFPSLRALGLALPGFAVGGVLTTVDYPGLRGSRLAEHFHTRFGVPVLLENDVNAAAWGRALSPGASASEVYLYVPEKYPPGAGLCIQGRLVRGRGNFAGEVGYLPHQEPWTSLATLAGLIRTLNAVVAPEAVVIHCESLVEGDLATLQAMVAEGFPEGVAPDLKRSFNFAQDVQGGLLGLTRDLIDPLEVGPWPQVCS